MQVARGVLKFAVEKLETPLNRIVISGRSMGTGIATELAAEASQGVCALVLLSPYAHMDEVVAGVAADKTVNSTTSLAGRCIYSLALQLVNLLSWLGQTTLCKPQRFIQRAVSNGSSTTHLFIAHGKVDSLIPVEHAQRLFDLSVKSVRVKTVMHVDPTGGHADLEYKTHLAEFLNDVAKHTAATSDAEGNSEQQQQQRYPLETCGFATPEQIKKLRDAFPNEVKEAAAYKKRATLTFGVMACALFIAATLASIFAVRAVLHRYNNSGLASSNRTFE